MSQDGLAYSARSTALTEPTSWPSGSDWDTIAAAPLTATWPTGWSAAAVSAYTDGNTKDALYKYAIGGIDFSADLGSKGLCLGAAYAALVADTPTTTRALHNSFGASFQISSYYSNGALTEFNIEYMYAYRAFRTFTPPAGTTSCYLYYDGFDANFYSAIPTEGANMQVPPTWYVQFYLSTTSPGTIAAGDWAFGTWSARIKATETARLSTALSPPASLSTYDSDDAGSAHYLQARVDEVSPIFITGATWNDGTPVADHSALYYRPFSPDDGGTAYGTLYVVYHDGT